MVVALCGLWKNKGLFCSSHNFSCRGSNTVDAVDRIRQHACEFFRFPLLGWSMGSTAIPPSLQCLSGHMSQIYITERLFRHLSLFMVAELGGAQPLEMYPLVIHHFCRVAQRKQFCTDDLEMIFGTVYAPKMAVASSVSSMHFPGYYDRKSKHHEIHPSDGEIVGVASSAHKPCRFEGRRAMRTCIESSFGAGDAF